MSHSHKIAPHFHNGRFYNHPRERRQRALMPTITMLLECYWRGTRNLKHDSASMYAPVEPVVESNEPLITWIGHSTFLIQSGGINCITDPIFGDLTMIFPRLIPAGITLDALPAIDYVLISHNHRDHMDAAALNYIKKNTRAHFLVPQGTKSWFTKRGFDRVSEYTWWEQETFVHERGAITFTFLPALHWSQRGLFDFNKSLWGSWMIGTQGHDIYFAGDTAYSQHFSAIQKEFPAISTALMPIGPCEPRKWMENSHVSAEEAGQGFLDLQARQFVPMHWGTYSFGVDHQHEPFERLLTWWQDQKFEGDKELKALKVGERYGLPVQIEPATRDVIERPVEIIQETQL